MLLIVKGVCSHTTNSSEIVPWVSQYFTAKQVKHYCVLAEICLQCMRPEA